MKNVRMKVILRLLCTFLITSVCFFGYTNVHSAEYYYAPIEEVKVEKTVVVDSLVIEEEKVEEPAVEPITETVVATPQFVEPEIVGNSISVAGIKRRLMYDTNGDHFYLNHNINGEYDGIGIPYVDFRHDFTGRKTIIYSHSSQNGSGPFQALQNYHNNPSFYNANKTISINYNGNVYNYLIFSVYVSVADSEESEGLEYFHQMDYTDEEWAEKIQEYKSRSEYDTGVSVNANDNILILQTCSMDPNYYEKYYRYNLLIMGKLV